MEMVTHPLPPSLPLSPPAVKGTELQAIKSELTQIKANIEALLGRLEQITEDTHITSTGDARTHTTHTRVLGTGQGRCTDSVIAVKGLKTQLCLSEHVIRQHLSLVTLQKNPSSCFCVWCPNSVNSQVLRKKP